MAHALQRLLAGESASGDEAIDVVQVARRPEIDRRSEHALTQAPELLEVASAEPGQLVRATTGDTEPHHPAVIDVADASEVAG